MQLDHICKHIIDCSAAGVGLSKSQWPRKAIHGLCMLARQGVVVQSPKDQNAKGAFVNLSMGRASTCGLAAASETPGWVEGLLEAHQLRMRLSRGNVLGAI